MNLWARPVREPSTVHSLPERLPTVCFLMVDGWGVNAGGRDLSFEEAEGGSEQTYGNSALLPSHRFSL
jgi:hypothetical protein